MVVGCTLSFQFILCSLTTSSKSSCRKRTMPTASSSCAIQCRTSYSLPSSKGPTLRPASSIFASFRFAMTFTGLFWKMKSASSIERHAGVDSSSFPLRLIPLGKKVLGHIKCIVEKNWSSSAKNFGYGSFFS